MNLVEIHQQGLHFIYDSGIIGQFNEAIFDPNSHKQQHTLVGHAMGRGTTHFVKINGSQCVLRHYCRGGMVAKLLADQYMWTGLAATRAWRELHLLQRLVSQSLPVPMPVAARVVHKGLFYSADLITQRICDAQPLAASLTTRTLDSSVWRRIGLTIRSFHRRGVYHADLNAHNILVDKHNKIFIIDFDKGELRTSKPSWQQQNIARLKRSLDKLEFLNQSFFFGDSEWHTLMDAYLNSTK